MTESFYTEYGVKEITLNKTWEQLIKEAKELAPLEIKAIKTKINAGCWQLELSKLVEIINM